MRSIITVRFGGIIFLMLMFVGVSCCQAANSDLLDLYAPVYQFTAGECCYPVDVEFFIENSALYEYTDVGSIIITNSPSIDDLAASNITSDWYLDNKMGTILDNGIIAHYQAQAATRGYTVYGNVSQEADIKILQYWMFYVFNKGTLNIHEGDWEVVQVILENNEPIEVSYSQHLGGQRATWNQVEREGDHIVVYVAQGTHANYLRSFSGKFGISNDVVGSDGRRLENNEYSLVELTNQKWLDFSGHWGYYGGLEDELRGKAGPLGPIYRENGEMWSAPLVWGATLTPADDTMFLVEWLLTNFILIFLFLTILSVVILVIRIYKRYINYGLGPRIISLLYIDGVNKKTIGNILCIIGIIIAFMALMSQWYVVSADINVPGQVTGGFVDLISIDGMNGVEVNLLDPEMGITPISVFILPFSLLIIISLVFLLLGTIGVSTSRKLGKKFIGKGIRLLIPVIIILIVFMVIGSVVNFSELTPTEAPEVSNIFSAMGGSPWGGESSYSFISGGTTASATVRWGLGQGGIMLLISGILLLVAGMIEMSARTTFFKEKTIDDVLAPLEKKNNTIQKQKEKKDDGSVEPPSEET